MKLNLINWLKKKDNYKYVLFPAIGISVGWSKYGFLPTIIGLGIMILIGGIFGLILRLFIK